MKSKSKIEKKLNLPQPQPQNWEIRLYVKSAELSQRHSDGVFQVCLKIKINPWHLITEVCIHGTISITFQSVPWQKVTS